MVEGASIDVAQKGPVFPRPREQTARHWRLVGLLLTAGVGTAFWVPVLVLVSHTFAFELSARVTIGFGLAVAASTFAAAAIATAGGRSDQGQTLALGEVVEQPANPKALEGRSWHDAGKQPTR